MPESQSDLHWIVQLWRQLQLAIQTHNMYPRDVKVDFWFICRTESITLVNGSFDQLSQQF